ncbi:MAG: rod shape-determining protein MreD [Paraprevotella sp.]|nr:rod shape-determining protein MreD [Paraprevotella sp.]
MVQSFFKRLLWAFVLLAFQVLVFNHIHWFGYATPIIYVYILCIQPLNTSRYTWLLWGFVVGLVADLFSETPGLGAASMTLTAMIAPLLILMFNTN